jgi:hypothetical protein
MSDTEKAGRLVGWGIATALLCLAATAEAAAEPEATVRAGTRLDTTSYCLYDKEGSCEQLTPLF